MLSCLMQLLSNDITPDLDEALQMKIQAAFLEIQEKVSKHHRMEMRAGMSHVMVFQSYFNIVFYHVLRIVNPLHRITDIKRPLLRVCSCRLQALNHAILWLGQISNACRSRMCRWFCM
ncbi:hypothetical protein NL676_030558 [Syzygium grande]|nr:hypothetical protein NL676_030558 [Syzygium grande]